MNKKWQTVLLLAAAELLAMGLWFSASAVTPILKLEWALTSGDAAWLTMSVQIGFVIGAFVIALFNLADIWPAHLIFAGGATVAAVANAAIAGLFDAFAPALALRFFTGFALAAVYPVGMKIMATWMKEDRGLGLGLLVGALTLGKALPHLLRVLGEIAAWQQVLYIASALALLGGIIVWLFGKPGPYDVSAPPFRWRYIGEALRDRGVRLANFGYLGHMWELYAMWTWIPIFLLESYRLDMQNGNAWIESPARLAAVMSFTVIGAGGLGSLLAGRWADLWGRTRITIISLIISGVCSLIIGLFFGAHSILISIIALIWGFAVVADSAQFSTSVSELCEREYIGTVLTLQTSLGFLLTLITIRLIPLMVDFVGWTWAFAILALGPVFGIRAMWALRQTHATKLAGGRG